MLPWPPGPWRSGRAGLPRPDPPPRSLRSAERFVRLGVTLSAFPVEARDVSVTRYGVVLVCPVFQFSGVLVGEFIALQP